LQNSCTALRKLSEPLAINRAMTISTEDPDLADLACGMTAGSVRELLALRACTTPGRPAFSSAGGGRELTYDAGAGRPHCRPTLRRHVGEPEYPSAGAPGFRDGDPIPVLKEVKK
jgi:hypothetical protein